MKEIDIKLIKENPENPRTISKDKFEKLINSIKNFPQMLRIRPLVVDENNIVLGGNMRLRALKELAYKKVPVIQVKDLTKEQKKEFIIKDNVGFGEWDYDILANEWDSNELNEWGLDIPEFPEQKDLSDELEQKFKIEVECISESEQEKLFNEFKKRNLPCRLLTL